jgi:hypothetical protein
MRRTLLILWAAAVFAGCSDRGDQPEFPELHPVTGVVTRSGAPVSGGVVQFQRQPATQEFLVNGVVGPDGAFSLSTVRTTDSRGERRDGAPAGEYRVTYLPEMLDQTAAPPDPITLQELQTVASTDNTLSIELPGQ